MAFNVIFVAGAQPEWLENYIHEEMLTVSVVTICDNTLLQYH